MMAGVMAMLSFALLEGIQTPPELKVQQMQSENRQGTG